MRYAVILLGFLSLAMGGKRPDVAQPGNTASPEPIQVKFKSLGQTFGAAFVAQTVSFSFTTFFGSTIGMCRMSSSGRNSVQLSSSAWSRGSATFQEMLVFHELGHCLLGRGHKNTRMSSGQPESLMNSFIFDERTYLANRDQYLKELFTAENVRAATQSLAAKSFDGCEFSRRQK